RTATISGTWSPPARNTPYKIFATMTVANATRGATTTVQGYNTHFRADIQVGDAIIGANSPWSASTEPEFIESYVTAVNSDTSVTVINSGGITASTYIPSAVWIAHQWQPGDCGVRWLSNHWSGALGVLPSLYPMGGGNDTGLHTGAFPATQPGLGSNNAYPKQASWMA